MIRTAVRMAYVHVPGARYSEKFFIASLPLNCANAPGTTISDDAKMIGITPAELMRSGMKFFAASRIRPRAIERCGIWMAMRRAAMVIVTTQPTTATIDRKSVVDGNRVD